MIYFMIFIPLRNISPLNVTVPIDLCPQHLGSTRIHTHAHISKKQELTLHPATIPSPPAHTMVVLTAIPHQSGWEQVAWSATGIKACCSLSAMGPPAKTHGQSLLPSSTYTSSLSNLLYSISSSAKFTVRPKIFNLGVPLLPKRFQLKSHACNFHPNSGGFG